MKTLFATTTAIALALGAGLALAEDLSPAALKAKQQLADNMDVNAADYTLAELSQMKCIMEGDYSDADRQRLIDSVKGFGDPDRAAAEDKAQLASSLGVDPNVYTLSELSLLKSMVEDEECDVDDPAEYVRTRGENLSEPAASAKMQLALALGVDPRDYTLLELVKMKSALEGEASHN